MIRRLLRALANIIFLLVILITRGCMFRPATYYFGDHFNRGKNAVWLGIEWVNDSHTVNEITDLANELKARQIGYVFVYTAYLHQDGQFGQTYAHATDFLATFHQVQPNIQVLAWIGLPLSYIDLTDERVRLKIAGLCGDFVHNSGFDGVHLDPEPLNDKTESMLTLLDETRSAIGAGSILSIATGKTYPIFPDTLTNRFNLGLWSTDYYHEIAAHVDQMAVMVYDSGIESAALYRQLTHFEVIQISKAIAGTQAELLFGIPTSEEETPTHHASGENMLSGLQGVIDGLNDLEARPDLVTGVAIYPYWETTPVKWSDYERLWLGEQSP